MGVGEVLRTAGEEVEKEARECFSSQVAADLGDTGSLDLEDTRLRNVQETSCLQSQV